MYDCAVRLGGGTTNEVEKRGITAAEILVLRKVHGVESIVRIIPKNSVNASHASERDRLRSIYERGPHQVGLIDSLFGPVHLPLPESLDPALEADADEAVLAKEADEAEKAMALQIAIDKGVQEELAKREADAKSADVQAGINGRLTDEEIANRDAKREAGLKRLKAEKQMAVPVDGTFDRDDVTNPSAA
jgi:hypothetical protein